MFQIDRLSTSRGTLNFGPMRKRSRNRISIITGPNGSGKTEALTTLATYFRHSPKRFPVEVKWSSSNGGQGPTRVIAQTFSPFSRFAAPDRRRISLTETYGEGIEDKTLYRSIGVHRGLRINGQSLARQAIEQGLHRLSSDPSQAVAFERVLGALGFRDRILLKYRKSPEMPRLIDAYHAHALPRYLQRYRGFGETYWENEALTNEVQHVGAQKLAELTHQALDLLLNRRSEDILSIQFDFKHGNPSSDFAVIQALGLLKQLGFINLADCTLEMLTTGEKIDLFYASSGQQQLLASIFGLIGELKSDSLVLIDEPELSLHPSWQISFLERLEALLQPFDGCHVIIATHSPLVVQSALAADLEVFTLDQEHTRSHTSFYPITSDSRSVEAALVNVFSSAVPDSIYLADELFEIVAEAESGNQTERLRALKQLSQLRNIYAGDNVSRLAKNSLSLIDKAIRLVSDSDEIR